MIKDGWLDWAEVMPGIPDKVYSEPNRGLGLVGHSIVGSYQAALTRFMSTAKNPDGSYTASAAASVMFILCKDGRLLQMYPVTASTWTSGGREANTSYWAIEAEGGPPGNETEPLTDAQVRTLMRLCAEFEAYTGRKVVKGTTFREHGELARQLGYAPTACPSYRYGRFYEALEGQEAAMTADERKRLENIEKLLGGAENIAKLVANGNDLWAGYVGFSDTAARGLQRADQAHERIDRIWTATKP